MVSHRTMPKDRNKRAIEQISQSAATTAGGKGMSFLEDDLDTGEGLPINVSPQPTNKIPLGKARINTPNQLADSAPLKPPVAHLHASISHSFLIRRDASA